MRLQKSGRDERRPHGRHQDGVTVVTAGGCPRSRKRVRDQEDGMNQEIEHMDEVDVHPDVHVATEPDEQEILGRLYGPPDREGIFRGPPTREEGEKR
ncbi:hypothetical protein GCM10010177_45250 [Actinomadura citrea]|nr:hypothetical protein GCM10010177_45250 [Actinomadura citrea]